MKGAKINYISIDGYIALFPAEIQKKLKELRATIKAAAPDAGEKIGYQIPTFAFYDNRVHFAAFKDRISFFPTSSGVKKATVNRHPR